MAAIIGIIGAVSGSIFYVFNKTSPQTNETQQVTQSNRELGQKPSDEEGKILSGGGWSYKVYLKDSSTNSKISSATVEMLTKEKFSSCGVSGDWDNLFSYNDNDGDGIYLYVLGCAPKDFNGDTAVSIKISAQGYSSKTVVIKVSKNYGTAPKDYITISLSKQAQNQTTTTTTTVPQETIKDVTLPSVFGAKGSKTTDLSKLSDPKKVKKLTFDVVGKNRIVFTDNVNLSSDKTVDLFKKLDKYVKMTKIGLVEVNSKTLSMLAKKKASVSMFKLHFLDTPDVFVNGKPDTKKIVSNIKYDKGTLTFSVKNFSRFEAVPKLEILEPKNGFIAEQESITLRGKIGDSEASVSAKLNGKSLGNIKVATKSGEFSKDLTLKKGRNNLVVNAISKFGPPLEATVSGIFLPPIEAKDYTLGTTQIVGISILIFLLLVIVGSWWYYKKRKAS